MENLTTIAGRVKRARKQRGYSSALKLAQAMKHTPAEVSTSAITNIESGARVGVETLLKLAKFLRVPLEWLRDGEGLEPDWDAPTLLAPTRLYSPKALEIAEIYDSIKTPEVARKAYAVMVAFDERDQEAPAEPPEPQPAPRPAPLPAK